MQAQGIATRERPRRWRQAAIVAAIGWVVLVTIFFGIQAGAYAGLPAALAEWEFDRFGKAFPVINYILLVALFFLPAVLLLLYRRKRSRDDASAQSRLVLLVTRGNGLLRILVALIVGLLVAMLLLLIEIAGLPAAQGQPARITVPAVGGGVFREGPAMLVGRIRLDRTASYDQNLLLTRRTYRFVPVQAAGGGDSTLRFFVASEATGLSPSTPSLPRGGVPTGILRHAGLPGAVVRLYRDAGYVVAADHYVLYPDRAAIAWPLLITLVQLVLALLVLGIAAYVIRRQLHRTRSALLLEYTPL